MKLCVDFGRKVLSTFLFAIIAGFDIDFGSVPIPGTSQQSAARNQPPDPEDPAYIRELLLKNPHELSLLRERNPELAEALINGTFGILL